MMYPFMTLNDGTEIVLTDRESGEKNRIWISVQTGRIRWEEVH